MFQLLLGNRDVEPIELPALHIIEHLWGLIDHKLLGRVFTQVSPLSDRDASIDARFAAAWSCANCKGPSRPRTSIVLQVAGLDYSRDHVQRYRNGTGRTGLHLVATMAAQSCDVERTALVDLLRHLVADSSILNCCTVDGATALKVYVQKSWETSRAICLPAWLTLLSDAGVDLEAYGRGEIGAWIPWRLPRFSYEEDLDSYAVRESFTYGHSLAYWSPVFLRIRVIEVYRMRPPSGFWTNDTRQKADSELYLGLLVDSEESLSYLARSSCQYCFGTISIRTARNTPETE